jgi:hypothetical protein
MTEIPDSGDDDGDGVTAVRPDFAPTMAASELAWSQDDETEAIQRPPWRLAWAQSASVLAVAAVIAMVIIAMGGSIWVLTHRQQAVSTVSVAAPAPTVVTVAAPPPSTVTVQAAPAPTVTVQAAPSTTTVTVDEPPEPIATHAAAPLPSFQSTVPVVTAEDQAFLARQRADGWVITDYQQMLRTAHQVCFMFRQGESAQQVNQWLAALPGPGQNSMQMALSFSSNALLSYSEC